MNQLSLFEQATQPLNVIAKAFVPDCFTKQLKINSHNGRRRIRLSSNILEMMGWGHNTRTSMNSLGIDKGIEILKDDSGTTKIYQRSYKRRVNNPFETQIDIQNQNLIDNSIYNYTEELHFDIQRNRILVTPLPNRTFNIRRNIRNAKELEAFVAMSSGVDLHSLAKTGFSISGLLEYRPNEKRDKVDYTETGALCAMGQSHISNVFNEDISKIRWDMVKRKLEGNQPVSFAHISLQCDDFSNVKAKSLKERSVKDLDTTIDLVYDGLRMIEEINPGVVLVENVEGFGNSMAGQLMAVKLRKWGYHVTEGMLTGKDYGGLTKRKRYYLVASVFPGFTFPEQSHSIQTAWDMVQEELPNLRDVTANKSVQDGIKTKRIRLIKEGDAYSPTLLKSQNRMAKDSLYIEYNNRILFPNESLLRKLSGIPSDFNLNLVGETIGSEIIGQGIDYPMHDRIIESIYSHIQSNQLNSHIIKIDQ